MGVGGGEREMSLEVRVFNELHVDILAGSNINKVPQMFNTIIVNNTIVQWQAFYLKGP